jgi:predicted O-methyltransferase YrrM
MVNKEAIQGWFDSQELYEKMVKTYPNGHFVEVGAWLGASTSYMASLIKDYEFPITFDVVDHFLGDPTHDYQQEIVKLYGGSVYKQFARNMKERDCWKFINIIHIIDSISASQTYPDNSLDFVYLDASHDYTSVSLDIKNWYPKVKVGGTIAGDDYNSFKGVKKAVNEFFDLKRIHFSGDHTWEYNGI